jgi:hypothetical protein
VSEGAAKEGARAATINLSSADMMLGPTEGPMDPGVHAAVTQAMKTLTPDMLARNQGPAASSSGPPSAGTPAGVTGPLPLGPRGQGTLRTPIVHLSRRGETSRETTLPSQPGGPVWVGMLLVAVGTLLATLAWLWLG